MADNSTIVPPKAAPELNLPSSSSTVDVRIIHSTAVGQGPASLILAPHIPGHDLITFPCFAFLVSSASKKQNVLFDLGIRKDYWNLAPVVAARVTGDKPLFPVKVEKNISEILDADEGGLGIRSKDIDAIVFSHHHWDHVGDITTFPFTTDLVIGPGFSEQYLPAYPTKQDSALLDADFEGRKVREIGQKEFNLLIGQFAAHDFFGDGSFYLLHSPGHTVGHMCGLARTTADTFILMGADACHHGGEFRPTEYLPLPNSVGKVPRSRFGAGCPGAFLVDNIHPKSSATVPFYDIAKGFSHDHDGAVRTITKLQEFDASENVLVCIAHDEFLLDQVDFYPDKINDWKSKGVQEKVRWAFVGDYDLKAERPPPPKEGEQADYSWLSG